jgi:hypothetical protein
MAGVSVPDTAATPPQNSIGAPRGNRNRITSGLRSFVLGRYPPGCSYIARHGHLLRRQLREAVTTQEGSTNVWSEAVIASACQHECRRLLLLRWLRLADEPQTIRKSSMKDGLAVAITEAKGLGIMDKAALLDKIGQATDARDRCLKVLRLDTRRDASPWDDLYRNPPMLPAPATLQSDRPSTTDGIATQASHGAPS